MALAARQHRKRMGAMGLFLHGSILAINVMADTDCIRQDG